MLIICLISLISGVLKDVITSYSIHYTKLYDFLLMFSRERRLEGGNKMKTIIAYHLLKRVLATALLSFITVQMLIDPAVIEAASPEPIVIKIATLAPSA